MSIKEDSNDESIQKNDIKRRSFLAGVTAAITGITLLPAQTSCPVVKKVQEMISAL